MAQVIRKFYFVQNDHFDIIIYGADTTALLDVLNNFKEVERGHYSPLSVIFVRGTQDIKRYIDRRFCCSTTLTLIVTLTKV